MVVNEKFLPKNPQWWERFPRFQKRLLMLSRNLLASELLDVTLSPVLEESVLLFKFPQSLVPYGESGIKVR
jgi:hypothetical protein